MKNKDMNNTTTSMLRKENSFKKSEWKAKKERLKYYAHNIRHLILQHKSKMNWSDEKTDEQISRVNSYFYFLLDTFFHFFCIGRYGSYINRPTHNVYGAR